MRRFIFAFIQAHCTVSLAAPKSGTADQQAANSRAILKQRMTKIERATIAAIKIYLQDSKTQRLQEINDLNSPSLRVFVVSERNNGTNWGSGVNY
jgi:hypothetical protein